ncbi:MAG: efflux RND transporter periplasmic adaptor subunit [Patescibacteria group bacterium]
MTLTNLARKYRRLLSASALAIVVVAVIGCTAANREDEAEGAEKVYIPKVRTELVQPGLSRELGSTGEVQAAKSATLTAEARSDVQSVLVKVGDEVRAGQVLVKLDSDSIASTRSTAGAAFTNAQNSLAQTKLSSEQSVESAEVALRTAEINLQNTLKQNIALRKQAEETLNAAKLSSGLSVSSAQTTLDNAIDDIYPTAQAAVSECDEILGVSPAYDLSNESFENQLGVLRSVTKSAAKTAIQNALNALNSAPADYDSALVLLEAAEEATLRTLDVLNYSSTGAALTQASLNSYISTINTQLGSVRTDISTLESAQAALESAQQSTDGGAQAVVSAQANHAATIAQLDANEETARRSVESAQAALETALKSAELSRTSAKASLDAVAGTLSQAQISQSKLTIRAPFSGKVTAIEVEAGDEIAAGGALVRIEDASQLKIVTHFSASEVRKIKVGDEVGIATQSKDVIAAISPSADPVTKKYEVEIYHQNPYLQPGEFVKLRFQIGENGTKGDDRIFLPITAINVFPHESFVWVVEDNKVKKAVILIGDIEGEFVEIIDGLEPDQEVVVEGGRILEESDEGMEVEVI